MKILKNNHKQKIDDFKRMMFEPHLITCPHCTSELEYTMRDVTTERSPNGKSYITCEACNGFIVIPKS